MCKIIHGSKVAKRLKSFLVSRQSTYRRRDFNYTDLAYEWNWQRINVPKW